MVQAEVLFTRAVVQTLAPLRPRAGFVAVAGGRVVAVGQAGDEGRWAGPHTRVVDCGGGCLLPAFHDAHLHLLALASALRAVDCSGARSIGDIQQAIARRAKGTPPGRWLRAWGYDDSALVEGRHPDRHDLDAAAPLHPVRLAHRSGHAVVLNSQALRAVGITRHTPDPPYGVILRDAEGEPTGLLLEMEPFLEGRIPPLGREELEEGLREGGRLLLSRGITVVHDATPTNSPERWDLLAGASRRGLLLPLVVFLPGAEHLPTFLERGMGPHHREAGLVMGPAKFVLTLTTGAPWPPPELLGEQMALAREAGFGVAVHAVEEEAVLTTARLLARAGPFHLPPRVEHASECPPEAVALLRRAGAWVVTNPNFLYHRGDHYLQEVSPRLQPHLYPLARLTKAGVPLAFGSDAPVTPPDPLLGLRCAVTRRTQEGRVLHGEQAISPTEALLAHTAGPARMAGLGHLGAIQPGRQADLVLLSADPLATGPDALAGLEVWLTVQAGRIVWRA